MIAVSNISYVKMSSSPLV